MFDPEEEKVGRLMKSSSLQLLSFSSPTSKKTTEAFTRSLQLANDVTVTYEVNPSSIQFEGIQKGNIRYISSHSPLLSHHDQNMKSTPENPTTTASDFSVNKKIEEILPVICFIDGWLEEVKAKDSIIPYSKDKTYVEY